MPVPQGIVRFHQRDHTLTFRVEGKATIPNSLPMRLHAERALAAGTTIVRVDLRDCSYMDSTFLGTLLTLKKAVDKKGQFQLISPSVGCQKLFNQMGLTGMFATQVEDPVADTIWTDLATEQDQNSLKRNCATAHEALADLPGEAGKQFEQVARCLAQAAGDEKLPPKPQ